MRVTARVVVEILEVDTEGEEIDVTKAQFIDTTVQVRSYAPIAITREIIKHAAQMVDAEPIVTHESPIPINTIKKHLDN